jgi:hypothetical protein
MVFRWMFSLHQITELLFSQVTIQKLETQKQDGQRQLILRPGQIIEGKIIQLFPQQRAWIQLGHGFKVLAHVDLPLEAGQQKWFQVTSAAHPVILKVISASEEGGTPHLQTTQNNWTILLRWLGAEDTSFNRELLGRFLSLHVPLNRPMFQQVLGTLAQVGKGEREQLAALWAIQKGWPPTPAIVRSLVTFWENPNLIQLIAGLKQTLPPETNTNLPGILNRLAISNISPQNLKQFLQQLSIIPIEPHKGSASNTEPPRLPFLIQSLLNDPNISSATKSQAEQLMYFLAGQHLMLKGDNPGSPLASLFFHFLISHSNQLETIYGKIEGHHDKAGEINPDHCRMLLYARLQHLKETCMDVFIQNKWISIKLYNDAVQQNWLDEYKPILAKGLAFHGYQLSSLMAKKWEVLKGPLPKEPQSFTEPRPYQGVDIRL